MHERTGGGTCLGPTGSNQGGHWFMSFATGSQITCHRWMPPPMPSEVIQCVTHIGKEQRMPDSLTFAA